MTIPKIELRGISYSATLSDETNCYSAKLYVDGELWGEVCNRGNGGCDDFRETRGSKRTTRDLDALDDLLKAEAPKVDLGGGLLVDDTLELVCGRIVDQWLMEREFKRAIASKFLYTKPGEPGIYAVSLKHKGRVWTVADVKASYVRQGFKFDKILNELPAAEALALYAMVPV